MDRVSYKGKNKTNKKTSLTINQIIFLGVILITIIGLGIGVIYGMFVDVDKLNTDGQVLENILKNYAIQKNSIVLFKENILKYSKLLILIWFASFVPYGFIIGIITYLFKIISLGYTITIMLRFYENSNGFFGILVLLPQIIIGIPTFIYTTCNSLNFSFACITDKKMPNKVAVFEYCYTLLISLILIVVTVFLETNLIPNFINSILR